MKAAKPTRTTGHKRTLFIPLLAVLLTVLFWRSFLPGYVHFSNDGPLGAISVQSLHLPEAFTGVWVDLNTIGASIGSSPMGLASLLRMVLHPVGYAKFLVPIALFILGLGAWTFFRRLRLSPLAVTLGALAAAFNGTFFVSACWGVATQQIAIGMDFFALALVVSNTEKTPTHVRWLRLSLAGLAVGINVMEAADIGAIFSLFVAAFVLVRALVETGDAGWLKKLGRGIGSVAVIALFAGFIAWQTIATLAVTQISGVVGMKRDPEALARHWDEATRWSEPKKETLGLFVPGLFGYKMDTPKDMMPAFRNSYKGGYYWGGVGRDPALDAYFDSGSTGPEPGGLMRFTSGGNYCGILVGLVALWAVTQSLRRRESAIPEIYQQRWYIRFWAAMLIGSLLFAYGRYAPFYKFLYMVPYASTIRNPTKFLIVFSWVIVILFAYGIHGLSRRYLGGSATLSISPVTQFKSWWARVRGLDRNWTWFCILLFTGSVLAWVIYASEKPNLVHYLQRVGFGDENMAQQIAAFSIGQVGWFLVLLALAAGLCVLVTAGVFSGKRARLGGFLLGLLLTVDLIRADLPYIVHWDYQQKYASNPVLDFLRDKPYEHRVAYGLPRPLSTPSEFEWFDNLYKIEWLQHQFPYYEIQSLDVVQMPRPPEDLAAFDGLFDIGIRQGSSGQLTVATETFPRVARLWELTNTRYLLGPAALLDLFNEQFDPGQHRFRIVQRFNVRPKPGIEQPTELEQLTAVPNENGPYALFEFTGALPRVTLYSHWQVSTNNDDTLHTLASTNFDVGQTVLVSTPLPVAPALNTTHDQAGTVEFKSYAPKDLVFDAKANVPAVLLLNDKHDPHWRVLVDGKPAELLRCNFIMRGVFLTPGPHTVEFKFALSSGLQLYWTCMFIGVTILLCGILFFAERRHPEGKGQP